jgi:hypothetical protein
VLKRFILVAILTADLFSQTAAQPNNQPHTPKWLVVPYPNMYDNERFAYDANSFIVIYDQKGRPKAADVTVRVVAGDESIRGSTMVLTFECPNFYRINHSYPLPLSSPTQESYIANIACGRIVGCAKLRQEGGSCGN